MKNQKYYKICPTCTYFCHIEEDDEYCAYCGTELITECPDCGKKINYPHGNYCKYCGSQIRKPDGKGKIFKEGPDAGHRF